MVRRRCKLCNEMVVGNSMFCLQHRAQAEVFTNTFGPHDDGAQSSTHTSKPEKVDADLALYSIEGEEGSALSVFFAALQTLSPGDTPAQEQSAEASPKPIERAPEVALYWSRDRFIARCYFSILAPEAKPVFSVSDHMLRQLRTTGSVVGTAIESAVNRYQMPLQEGDAHRLMLCFDRLEGVLRLELEQASNDGQREHRVLELARFKWAQDRFIEG